MRDLLIVTSSNRAIERECWDSVNALVKLGARHVRQAGAADVTFARNQALSMACEGIRSVQATAPFETVLMVDDDMVFDVKAVAELARESKARGVPCSAVYVTINQIPAAQFWKKAEDGKNLWLVGLGLVALPVPALLKLEQASPQFRYRKTAEAPVQMFREFCTSGVVNGEWLSEDFSLCKNLGGVHLLSVEAGHRKVLDLWPNERTLKELADADKG